MGTGGPTLRSGPGRRVALHLDLHKIRIIQDSNFSSNGYFDIIS
jgi:hypothetical protein